MYYEFKTNIKDVTNLKRMNLYETLLEFFEYYYDDGNNKQGKHWDIPENERIISVDGGLC